MDLRFYKSRNFLTCDKEGIYRFWCPSQRIFC